MSRIIKFRAWFEVEGLMDYDPSTDDGLLNANFTPHFGEKFMQYTGRHDKNGVEIWEGDIGRINLDNIGWVNCECVWDSNWAHFSWRKLNQLQATKANPGEGWSLGVPYFEVTGNVYENPELLEEDNGSH